jgi:flagellar hook-basal body complex protein FliE
MDKTAGVVGGVAERIGAQTPIGEKAFGSVGSPVATPFSGVLKGMVEQTQALGKKASDAVTGLLSGQGVEVHDVMIAQQKADASFELALQVRNKAVGAYQQLMGMQF